MAIANNFFNGRPTFLNDFANGQTLDNRITFLRSGAAVYYDGKSSALAEQNLIIQSNNFTTSWSLNAVATPTQNATDPSGTTNNAWTIAPSANLGQHILSTSSNVTVLASTNYVCTAYVQAGGSNYATLTLSASSSAYIALPINLTSGSVALGTPTTGASFTYVSSSITQVGSTAWYRVALIFSTALTSFYPSIQINNTFPPTISSYGYQVNWTATGTETILLYGFQLEQRSTATAYNQTTTTAINNFIPTLQSAPINTPRFDFNPVTGESLGFLIEQGSTNGLLWSEDFTNASWTKTNATITASANIAPDGTQSAQLLVPTTTNGVHQIYQATANTNNNAPSSWSIFAKAGGQRYLNLNAVYGGNNFTANFDLQAGTAGTTSGSLGYNQSSNITPVGNGWYRCSISFTGGGGAGGIYISVNNASTGAPASFAGDGFTGIYIWGSQYEPGYSTNVFTSVYLTSYIKTTTATVSRAGDNPSITGSNFTSFINLSQGTWYGEAQAGYMQANSNYPSILCIFNAAGTALHTFVAQNATTTTSAIVTTNTTLTPTINSTVNNIGVFNKQAYSYSNINLSISALGVTPLSSTNNNAIPTASYMQIGNGPNSTLNGHIKKIAYYPIAVTSANLQALTGS